MYQTKGTIGVVGAGQLGRMLHQAAIGPGFALRFLAIDAHEPAAQVCPDHHFGSAMDPIALAEFAASVAVVTFEHEVVALDALDELAANGAVLRPGAAALRMVADKLEMRRAVGEAGLAVPPWRRADTVEGVLAALDDWGGRAVLKLSRGGYDGRGVFVVDGAEEAVAVAGEILARGVPLLVEPVLDFDAEIAVIVARRPGGESVVYDPVVTVQIDGQCRECRLPSGLGDEIDRRARAMATAAADALDIVGLLAMELFVVDGALSVNELAVRPHNTGHHGIDVCVTSQFENHLRAVSDLPLGDPGPTTPAAAMVNIIGHHDGSDPRWRLADAMAVDPGARIHLYGKEPRADRKLGHVTVADETADAARRRAWAVVDALGAAIPDPVRSTLEESP